MVRLQKLMASSGIASRRKCEAIILDGRVTVNGEVVTELGTKVDEEKDVVKFDGKPVRAQNKYFYFMLHKPERIVSSAKDEKDRETVVDLIDCGERLYPIGRLDFMSSGLILLTNDGKLTYKLTHPKHEIAKVYEVVVKPPINMDKIEKLRNGVVIDRRRTFPAKVKLLEQRGEKQVLSIAIKEGRNRQIRKMVEAVGSNVIKLKRVAVGDIRLGNLEYGAYRALTEKEIKYLKGL